MTCADAQTPLCHVESSPRKRSLSPVKGLSLLTPFPRFHSFDVQRSELVTLPPSLCRALSPPALLSAEGCLSPPCISLRVGGHSAPFSGYRVCAEVGNEVELQNAGAATGEVLDRRTVATSCLSFLLCKLSAVSACRIAQRRE